MNYKTDQESFWEGAFGNNYIDRNNGKQIIASNINFFSNSLRRASKINSCIEFGSNIGNNLLALRHLLPNINLHAIEINSKAIMKLKEVVPDENIFKGSILEYKPKQKFDLVLVKGVLIHLNQEYINEVYSKLVESSSRYILLAEYYNPKLVSVNYRGYKDKLFKRDFAGELLDNHPNMALLDYGFCYHRDNLFPADDYTWFLIKKTND